MFDLKLLTLAGSKGTSYFYSVFGTTLVLFVMGLALLLGFEAKKITGGFRENLVVELVLKDSLSVSQISEIQHKIEQSPFCKQVNYISKQKAAETLQKDLGEDFLDVLGYNPLYGSFIINLKEEYANTPSTEQINEQLSKLEGVQQVNFQKNIVEKLDENMRQISLVALIITGLLLAFAVSLIFSTIRLAIFSRRFTIKTMQLFGATKWFIIKPFLGRSIFNGLLSGILSCILLIALIWYFDYTLPNLGLQGDLVTFALLFGGLVLFGVVISFFSTLTAVLRYLRMKVDDLY